MKKVLVKLSNCTNYKFTYSDKHIRNIKVGPYSIDDLSIEKIMDISLAKTGLTYSIIGDIVVIKKEVSSHLANQQITNTNIVKGVITNSQGTPISFANIYLKGSGDGTVSKENGQFEIQNVEILLDTLVVSCLGFKTFVQPIVSDDFLEIELKHISTGIGEVIITGYQTLSKERTSGAFSILAGKRLEMKNTRNLLEKLEGETTGILFDENGDMFVRGISTMMANTNPLIVMDGFPVSDNFLSINPNDIESITILKDAAAASIWGARASNGVIVIESKSGKVDAKTSTEFSYSQSISEHPDLYKLPYAPSSSLLAFEKHIASNGLRNLPPVNMFWRAINQGLDTHLKVKNGVMEQELADGILFRLGQIDSRDEFTKLFLQRAIRHQYNVNVSGGGEKSSYFSSVNYDKTSSVVKGNSNDRLITNLRLAHRFNKILSINGGIQASRLQYNNNEIEIDNIADLPQYQIIIGDDGAFIPQPTGVYQGTKDHFVAKGYPENWDYNMYQEYLNDNKRRTKVDDLRINAGLSVDIFEGVRFKGKVLYSCSNEHTRNVFVEDSYYVRDWRNKNVVYAGNEFVSVYPEGSVVHKGTVSTFSLTSRGQLDINKELGKKQFINSIIGYEVMDFNSSYNFYVKRGYDSLSKQFDNIEEIRNEPIATLGDFNAEDYDIDLLRDRERFISLYGNFSFSFNSRLTLTTSGRIDASNLIGVDFRRKSIPLWSVGFRYDLNNRLLKWTDFFDRLTIRGSYGMNGNVERSTSPHLIIEEREEYYNYRSYGVITNPKNSALRWESTKSSNIGLDYALFENQMYGNVDFYYRYSEDLLANSSHNSTYGFEELLMNSAEMSNKGIEVRVAYHTKLNNFNWETAVNFNYNVNKVEHINMRDNNIWEYLKGRTAVGLPLNYIYSYKWAGLSQNGLPRVYNENGEVVEYPVFVNSADALEYSGTSMPPFHGSWTNNFSFKGIYVGCLVMFKFGHIFRRSTMNYLDMFKPDIDHIHKDYDKRWKVIGDEKTTNVPKQP
ncbi:MAG: SusC/RagA family TonB-linked outer membrane protein, partial [Bacteroidales bacterium]|nr:SusC/RagA family TonB-linked outer membrane protein [Bacteroidales bacterium]